MKTYESRTFQVLTSQCLGKELARGDAHLLQPFVDIFPVDIGIGKRKFLRGYQTARKAKRIQQGMETFLPTILITKTKKLFLEYYREYAGMKRICHHIIGIIKPS